MGRKTTAKKQATPEIFIFDWKVPMSDVISCLESMLAKLGVVVGHFSLGTDDYIFSFGKRKATAKEVEKAFCCD